jgi:hypothetical protein
MPEVKALNRLIKDSSLSFKVAAVNVTISLELETTEIKRHQQSVRLS